MLLYVMHEHYLLVARKHRYKKPYVIFIQNLCLCCR